MSKEIVIRGSGGNSKGSSAASGWSETADNLSSQAYVHVVDLLGEGRIYGFPNSYHEDTYLNDIPLVSAATENLITDPQKSGSYTYHTTGDGGITAVSGEIDFQSYPVGDPVSPTGGSSEAGLVIQRKGADNPSGSHWLDWRVQMYKTNVVSVSGCLYKAEAYIYIPTTNVGTNVRARLTAENYQINPILDCEASTLTVGAWEKLAVVFDPRSTSFHVGIVMDGGNTDDCIYVSNIAVQKLTYNYDLASIEIRTGQDYYAQSPFWSIDNISSDASVETEVTKAVGPIEKGSLGDESTHAIAVIVRIPALYYLDSSNGKISETSVNFAIDIESGTGNWINVHDAFIHGKCTSDYYYSYNIDNLITGPATYKYGGPPYNIRVRRISDDSTTNYYADTYFDRCEVLSKHKFIMPDMAAVCVKAGAKQFGSRVPSRKYNVKGKSDLLVPANYDPIGRIYKGPWDGTFVRGWTNNPAWIFYDIVTNERYGLNRNADIKLSKWKMYEIAQWCDGRVPVKLDGESYYEHRFEMNVNITTREEAFHLLNAMASAFWSKPYYAGGMYITDDGVTTPYGMVYLAQDSPSDPTHIASPSNVKNGMFNYASGDLKNLFSAVMVSYSDQDLLGETSIECVTDSDLLAKIGWVQNDVYAVGCTRRSQAIRYGKWLLDTEKNQSETVKFTGSFYFSDCMPGNVVEIADPLRQERIRYSGRIAAIAGDGSTVTIDSPISITPGGGVTYTIYMSPSDAYQKITNGEFSSDLTGWTYDSSSTYADVTRVDYGSATGGSDNYCMKLLQHDSYFHGSDDGFGAYAYQSVNVTPGDTYSVSARVCRPTGSDLAPRIEVYKNSISSANFIAGASLLSSVGDDTWATLSVNDVEISGVLAVIVLRGFTTSGASGHYVYFDRVQMHISERPVSSMNIIGNGEFSSTPGTYWTGNVATVTRKNLYEDLSAPTGLITFEHGVYKNWVGKVKKTNSSTGACAYQEIETRPGVEYTLTAQAFCPTHTPATNNVGIFAADTLNGSPLGSDYVTSENEWQALSCTFTAAGTTTHIHLAVTGTTSTDYGYFDSIVCKINNSNAVVSSTISAINGTGLILTLSSALPSASNDWYGRPGVGGVWAISDSSNETTKWRVVSNTESSPNEYDITAIYYDENKWDRIEQGINISSRPPSDTPSGPLEAPSDLAAYEFAHPAGNNLTPAVNVSWTTVNDVRAYYYDLEYARKSNILTADGDFSSSTGWTGFGSGWTNTGEKAVHSSGTTALHGTTTSLNTLTYDVYFDIASRTAGSVIVTLGSYTGSGTMIDSGGIEADGSYHVRVIATSDNQDLYFTPTTDFDGSIDNVKVFSNQRQWQLVKQISEGHTDIIGVDGGYYYDFRVRAAGLATSSWVYLENVSVAGYVAAVPAPNDIWIESTSPSTTFTTKDCRVFWDDVTDEDYMPPSRLRHYELEFLTLGDVSKAVITVQGGEDISGATEILPPNYNLTYEQNIEIFGSATASFKVRVRAVDIYNQVSEWSSTITASASTPVDVTDLHVKGQNGGASDNFYTRDIVLNWAHPFAVGLAVTKYVGYRIRVYDNSQTPGVDDPVATYDRSIQKGTTAYWSYTWDANLEDFGPTDWAALTAYTTKDFVQPTTPNGFKYKCTVAGTSGATEPTDWPTADGETKVDGGVTWTCYYAAANGNIKITVTAVDVFNQESATPDQLQCIAGTPPTVTGLDTVEGSNTFSWTNCKLVWDDIVYSELPSTKFRYYLLKIYDTSDNLKRTVKCSQREYYTYTLQDNDEDFSATNDGWPSHTFKVSVWAVDYFGHKSASPATITVTASSPENVTDIKVRGGDGGTDYFSSLTCPVEWTHPFDSKYSSKYKYYKIEVYDNTQTPGSSTPFNTYQLSIKRKATAVFWDYTYDMNLEDFGPSDWDHDTAYTTKNFVQPTVPNGFKYKCIVAGTSAGEGYEPTWPTTIGGTVVDGGTLTWSCQYAAANDDFKVAVTTVDVFGQESDTPNVVRCISNVPANVTTFDTEEGSNAFIGPDCKLIWDSIICAGSPNTLTRYYRIQIKDLSNNLKRTVTVPASQEYWTYTLRQNTADFKASNGGYPSHTFKAYIVAVNYYGKTSASEKYITVASTSVPNIANLELNEGEPYFSGKACSIIWDDAISTTFPAGRFEHYKIRFKRATANKGIVQTLIRSKPKYTLQYDDNVDWFVKPQRAFYVGVNVVDCFGEEATEQELLCSNPAPSMIDFSPIVTEYTDSLLVDWSSWFEEEQIDTAETHFTANTGWTYTGWTITTSSPGYAQHNTGNVNSLSCATICNQYGFYKITIGVDSMSAGSFTVQLGAVDCRETFEETVTTPGGEYYFYARCALDDAVLYITPSSDCNVKIDYIYVHNSDTDLQKFKVYVDSGIVSDTIWEESTAYGLGDSVRPTVLNGRRYVCTDAGTSGGTEPDWGTAESSVTTDGGVEWTCYVIAPTTLVKEIGAKASKTRLPIGSIDAKHPLYAKFTQITPCDEFGDGTPSNVVLPVSISRRTDFGKVLMSIDDGNVGAALIATDDAWADSTVYSLGDIVQPTTANGFRYVCTTAGTSGATEPLWTVVYDDTTSDGTVEWTAFYATTVNYDEDGISIVADTASTYRDATAVTWDLIDNDADPVVEATIGTVYSYRFEDDVPADPSDDIIKTGLYGDGSQLTTNLSAVTSVISRTDTGTGLYAKSRMVAYSSGETENTGTRLEVYSDNSDNQYIAASHSLGFATGADLFLYNGGLYLGREASLAQGGSASVPDRCVKLDGGGSILYSGYRGDVPAENIRAIHNANIIRFNSTENTGNGALVFKTGIPYNYSGVPVECRIQFDISLDSSSYGLSRVVVVCKTAASGAPTNAYYMADGNYCPQIRLGRYTYDSVNTLAIIFGATDSQMEYFSVWVSGLFSSEDVEPSDSYLSGWSVSFVTNLATNYDNVGSALSIRQSRIYSDTKEPTGFINRTDSTLAFNTGTREFSITPAVTSFSFYSSGVLYTKSAAVTKTITTDVGLHYIYFDTTGTIQEGTSAWDINSGNVPIATAYWNGSTGLYQDERHGIQMDGQTHEYLHETRGAAYASGLSGTFAADGSTISIGAGEWYDEDIEHVNASPLTQCRVFWRIGSTWNWTSAQNGYFHAVSSVPQYNNSGALADVDASKYSMSWIFQTNNATTPISVIMGQGQYNTQAQAEAITPASLTLGTLPAAEMLLLYRVVWQRNGSVITWKSTADYRQTGGGPITNYVATDHSALSNLDYASSGHTGFLPEPTSPEQGDVLYYNGSSWVALNHGTSGQVLTTGGHAANPSWTSAGAGDVTATLSITDHALVRGDGGAKGIQGSGITVDDSNNVSGMGTLSCGNVTGGTYNKVTVTAPASGSTLTIANGKTLTCNSTLIFSGTDSIAVAFGGYNLTLTTSGATSLTLPTSGTVATTSNKLSAFAATTSAELAGVISDETGSGLLVFATSPSLTTPSLGVATATSINKVALTAPASGSTLTIADGKTLTCNSTLTFSGTDSIAIAFGGNNITLTTGGATSVTLPTSGTLATLAGTETLTNKTLGTTTLDYNLSGNSSVVKSLYIDTDDSGTNTGTIDGLYVNVDTNSNVGGTLYGVRVDVTGNTGGIIHALNTRGGYIDIGKDDNMYINTNCFHNTTSKNNSIMAYRGLGTEASPVKITSGTEIFEITALGWHTDGVGNSGIGAQMTIVAKENWGSTAYGTDIVFSVAPVTTASVAERLRISSNVEVTNLKGIGNWGFNNVTPSATTTGWSVSNAASDKSFDANATSIDELADVLGTLITELIAKGILSA